MGTIRLVQQNRQKSLEEAKQRAILANPQKLNGQQLDALLTEEYMEKKGWK